jgi:hypothetical protein
VVVQWAVVVPEVAAADLVWALSLLVQRVQLPAILLQMTMTPPARETDHRLKGTASKR